MLAFSLARRYLRFATLRFVACDSVYTWYFSSRSFRAFGIGLRRLPFAVGTRLALYRLRLRLTVPVSHRRFRSRLRFAAVGILCPRSCFRPFRLRVIFLASIRVHIA